MQKKVLKSGALEKSQVWNGRSENFKNLGLWKKVNFGMDNQ